MRDELSQHLRDFDALGTGKGPFDYRRAVTHDGGDGPHLVVGSMIHGDEVGSLPAVVELMDALLSGRLSYRGKLTAFVGNPEAGLEGRRFLESDLNRVFTDAPPDDHEGRRARELLPILDAADMFLDLHQTILATEQPFYICPFQVDGWRWARVLEGASMWVTRHPGAAYSSGTMCADEYVRARGCVGMTLELGEKGFGNGAEPRAARVLRRLVEVGDAVSRGVTTLEGEARSRPEPTFLETRHREPFASPEHALRPGLVNFTAVEEGDRLSAPGTPELIAPMTGHVLFPKYPPRQAGRYVTPLPGEIFRIVSPLEEHPTVSYADALGED